MSRSATFSYDDPIPYQAGIWGAEVRLSVTAKGAFRGELTQIDLGKLWIQHGYENQPCITYYALNKQRSGIGFSTEPGPSEAYCCGIELGPGAIFVLEPGASYHSRTRQSFGWASMSLPVEELSTISRSMVGCDLTRKSGVRLVRPEPAGMARLVGLHAAAHRLAVNAPDTLLQPQVSLALENELVHAFLICLDSAAHISVTSGWRNHTKIIDRFEQILTANCDRPMYLTEICSAVGASERTLRASCEEHLGMGPVRYLWLRRMHLARRALLHADPATATVTQIATDHGFWELGRFSVSYHALFGESPSASLRNPPRHPKPLQVRPFSLADSDFA